VRDRDAPLGQDQFHIAQAEAEAMVHPHGMADDLGREAVSGIGNRPGVIAPASPSRSDQTTAR
jgi:hypothetical protein